MLALEGIKILDLTRNLSPGAFTTMILGDLGCEVIKVEPTLEARARQDGMGEALSSGETKTEALFKAFGRNKKSIELNLKAEKGCHIFYQLSQKADVIVEGFRPGVVKRLGIDYETINKINPRIIYCSITRYGQDGPYRGLPGHDINYISLSGALDLIGERNGRPVIPLNSLADGGGGLVAALGILAALIVKLSETPGKIRTLAPVQGENTKEILRDLGYREEDINNLHEEGVIFLGR